MNTFREVIQQVIDTNQKLLDGGIDVKIANQIAINTQVIINAAKVQIEVMKLAKKDSSPFFEEPLALPEPIDKTLNEIKENQSKPYEFSKKVEDIVKGRPKQ